MDRTGMMEDARQELQAQLDRYDHDGVTLVNWLTTQDDQVCPLCASREQTVLTIAEARHILEGTFCQPREPEGRCRCLLTVVEGRSDEMP
jgi:hypothetical protein